jgi:DNA (cytosine-5)-methyltransferase 1
MKHGSLFSGIGGFDLAAEWMGWDNIFHCEWNPFGQKVLKHYWPKAISYHDITKTDFTIHRGNIDILTGGFPCQPYSMAGKRLGKDDERHLWPEMLRAIREIQPRWVVGENVLGLVNWNGGLVFEEVQADLETEGYEVQPYVLPACAVNAPHRRDRVWFVAYANRNTTGTSGESRSIKRNGSNINVQQGEWGSKTEFNNRSFAVSRNVAHPNRNGLNQCNGNDEINASQGGFNAFGNADKGDGYGDAPDTESQSSRWKLQQRQGQGEFGGCDSIGDVADTDEQRLERTAADRNMGRQQRPLQRGIESTRNWQNFPTQSPICSRNDGLSSQLDGITFSKWRNESIKAAGNAIVPQLVYQIFKAIGQYEQL